MNNPEVSTGEHEPHLDLETKIAAQAKTQRDVSASLSPESGNHSHILRPAAERREREETRFTLARLNQAIERQGVAPSTVTQPADETAILTPDIAADTLIARADLRPAYTENSDLSLLQNHGGASDEFADEGNDAGQSGRAIS